MLPLRFLHVADLHLGAPFVAASHNVDKSLAENIQTAPYNALRNLVQLCHDQNPNFVIFSGDIYNDTTVSLRALLALKDAFESLETLGISVYFAHGNHDSLQKTFASVVWPSNVQVFGNTWEYFDYFNPTDSSSCARIYGISHASERERKNLVTLLEPDSTHMLQIGVLHTSLDGETEGNKGVERYAPCSVKNLRDTGFSYWALGHVHGHQIVEKDPHIVYPGSLQGLHINEQDAHGVYMVTFETCTQQARPNLTFFPLAPVVWKILSINLDTAPDDIMSLETFLVQEIQRNISEPNTFHDKCTDLIIRVKLEGHNPLYQDLASMENQTDLCDSLEKKFANASPRMWIKDIQSNVKPVFDMENGIKREDLLGELLRHCASLRQEETSMTKVYEHSTKSLHSKIQKCTSLVPFAEKKLDMYTLLANAEQICIHTLSNTNFDK